MPGCSLAADYYIKYLAANDDSCADLMGDKLMDDVNMRNASAGERPAVSVVKLRHGDA